MKLLNNKVAIITGAAAAHGIGRAAAIKLKLAEAGAHVVITDLEKEWLIEGKKRQSYELLSQTVTDIEVAGGRALAMLADVTNVGNIQRCIESALSHFEYIRHYTDFNVPVNCIGVQGLNCMRKLCNPQAISMTISLKPFSQLRCLSFTIRQRFTPEITCSIRTRTLEIA